MINPVNESIIFNIPENIINPLVNISTKFGEIPAKCMIRKNAYSTDCLYKTICPQFNYYFIRTGLIIVIGYIVIKFLMWLFFKHLYKRLPNKKYKFWGNFHNIETRIYWDSFINARLTKIMLGYIVIVVYLSMRTW